MAKENPVLVCVTAQLSCEKLIKAGLELSQKLNRELVVVTVQNKNADAARRAQDLKALNQLSKSTGCSIDIIFSEHITQSLASYIHKIDPCHIFIGNPDSSGHFFEEFMSNVYEAPVSVVNDKVIYTLPAFQLDGVLNYK